MKTSLDVSASSQVRESARNAVPVHPSWTSPHALCNALAVLFAGGMAFGIEHFGGFANA